MSQKSLAAASLKYAYLHGFASSSLSTKGVYLSEWFRNERNIQLDLPDMNIPSFRRQRLSNMVDHVEKKIIESQSIWCLIGSSFGGLVSTLVAQRQPKYIHSLLLLAPALNPTQLCTSSMDIEQWKTKGFIDIYNPVTDREEPIDYEFFQDLQTHPSYPLVTTCPITIMHGLHDNVVPIETSREYMRRLSSSNKHPTFMFELDDDHHLRHSATLDTIKNAILYYHTTDVPQ